MRYENIKSAILTLLILVSIVLTWNLWTYQPNYETMENSKTVAEVTVSEKQEVQKIIKPDQALFHLKGGHYGTTDANQLDKLIRQLSMWTFFDVKDYSDKVGNIKQLTHGNGNAEIVFPGDLPIELYRSVLDFTEKKIPSFSFSRIIIHVESSNKENGIVYFVSSDYDQVFRCHISQANVNEFSRDFYKNAAAHYPQYFAFEATNKRTIFLPDAETEMKEYKYWPMPLKSDEFKKALFTDPSFVQKSDITNGEEYTNGFSKMTVNDNTNILLYVNPTQETNYGENAYDLVKRSIDFVNEHGGWTDPYRFVSKNEINHSVTFRLYSLEGYPVFNDQGTSEITEVWGRDEINKYVRPSIELGIPLTTEMQKVTRPSGHEALKLLKQNEENFKPELLDQMILGYQMERDSEEQRLILLEPTWFYRYDNVWRQIPMEELGGPRHGLE